MKTLFLGVVLVVMQTAPPIPRQAADNPTGAREAAQQDSPTNKHQPKSSPMILDEAQPQVDSGGAKDIAREDAGDAVRVSEPASMLITRGWADWAYWFFALSLAVFAGFQVWLVGGHLKT